MRPQRHSHKLCPLRGSERSDPCPGLASDDPPASIAHQCASVCTADSMANQRKGKSRYQTAVPSTEAEQGTRPCSAPAFHALARLFPRSLAATSGELNSRRRDATCSQSDLCRKLSVKEVKKCGERFKCRIIRLDCGRPSPKKTQQYLGRVKQLLLHLAGSQPHPPPARRSPRHGLHHTTQCTASQLPPACRARTCVQGRYAQR